MIQAKIIKDSLICNNFKNVRITTLELIYPRIIHAEFLTHRVFSRNSMSSRAIPTKKLIETYCNYKPENWRINQSGMQPQGIFNDPEINEKANSIWNETREFIIKQVERLNELGIAKEQVNRLLEPFMIIKTLLTSTKWDNFFQLRIHPDAQYEIRILATKIKEALDSSIPKKTEIHLPYITEQELDKLEILDLLKISVARCARISYTGFQGKIDYEKDFELYNKLINSNPMHASPSEHQAMSYKFFLKNFSSYFKISDFSDLNGNFEKGIIQFRKLLEKNILDYSILKTS